MEIEGKVTQVTRMESVGQDQVARVYVKAMATFPSKDGIALGGNDVILYGFEPEAKFALGQKVTIKVEDVA